jgi:hypothetical protein
MGQLLKPKLLLEHQTKEKKNGPGKKRKTKIFGLRRTSIHGDDQELSKKNLKTSKALPIHVQASFGRNPVAQAQQHCDEKD